MRTYIPLHWRGFTLVELTLVVAILSMIALFAVSRVSTLPSRARLIAARHDMSVLADAFTNPESGYLSDMDGIPGFDAAHLRLANLLIPTNLYGAAENNAFGMRVDDAQHELCAPPIAFTRWDESRGRGWRGPYASNAAGVFPSAAYRRFAGDDPAGARGFYPSLHGLRLPDDFLSGLDGCSIYGFPGEPAMLDPWGNPYVMQIPPPQAFPDRFGSNTNLPGKVRFHYARIVSAGPNGRLETPCFRPNTTNWWSTSWSPRERRLARQAGLIDGDDRSSRGDDLVVFLSRNDIDEGEEPDS